jgi:hypothetical protein
MRRVKVLSRCRSTFGARDNMVDLERVAYAGRLTA